MYSSYQDREEIEDDLYREEEGDSEGSEVNSEVEFRLYSQLHYSSNAVEDEEEKEHEEKSQDSWPLEVTANDDAEIGQSTESRTLSHKPREQQKPLKAGTKQKTGKGDEFKGKGASKGKRPSSSVFEEVIVIDSDPDVITLSEDDTAEDDDGVCAVKGRQLRTSTPAQKKRTLDEPVSVDSSSSESDSEESASKSASASSSSSDSSDSDDLENWMILGRETQEGDHCISLNLEGEAESNTDVEDFEDGKWLVSEKDREAQIYNKDKGPRLAVQRMASRYYTSKNVHCKNCNKTGHLSKNCSEPKKVSPCFLCGTPGHQSSDCPYKHCNNCGLPGHLYASCNERAYWHKTCHRCNMRGHFFDACPEIWRQYHLTIKTGLPVMQLGEDKGRTPAYCYNCAKRGHFGHDCTRQRMFNGTYPSTPFINHYDTTEDMNRRRHRIKMKVKELKKNGIMSTASESPSTPGPPNKKQKVSHDKNYHSHTTSGTNHPSPSHIFFSHTSSPKIYKHNKNKQQNCTSSEKRWKPTSRDPLPTPKLIVDETSDFPRGGGNRGDAERRRRKKKMKKNGRPDRLCWTASADSQSLPNEQAKKNKGETHRKGKNQAWRTPDKRTPQMYPTDENLFIIKQRKRKR
ncbi:zinc finger CCHC domain-containing protein 7 [Sphaeramia orbicularis]|uniref:zinc finger CCHC domain-containing protein 7 n=1 Tax=Sphaeramia orbicularis TaxID=375764 RepID=UPI00117E8332|nr:zinc finger CCHC domain-containing protein 7 [Sphaeramia orbicularis]